VTLAGGREPPPAVPFQAPGFHARSGYADCGRTPGYPHGHDDIHLVKQLG
jgi:hypothetical protein